MTREARVVPRAPAARAQTAMRDSFHNAAKLKRKKSLVVVPEAEREMYTVLTVLYCIP